MTIRALTRRNSAGQVYQRAPSVEALIAEALALPPSALLRRAAARDHQAAEFLPEECLVYLIREHFRAHHDAIVDQLVAGLLDRCHGFLHRKLQALGAQEYEDAHASVVAELIAQIVDLSSDRGDFLQVRFWVVLERLATTAFQRHLQEVKRAWASVPLGGPAGEEMPHGDDEIIDHWPLASQRDPSLSVVDAVIVRDELRRAQRALDCLPESHRRAYYLRTLLGWPIAANDPSVPTISRHFAKTPRTIQNWLDRADDALDGWRGAEA